MKAVNKEIGSFDLAKHVLTMDVLGIEKSERLAYITSHADVDIEDHGREVSAGTHSFVQVDAIFAALLSRSNILGKSFFKDQASVMEDIKSLSFSVRNILQTNTDLLLRDVSLPIKRLLSITKDNSISLIKLINNAEKSNSLKFIFSELENAFQIEPNKKGKYAFYKDEMYNAICMTSETSNYLKETKQYHTDAFNLIKNIESPEVSKKINKTVSAGKSSFYISKKHSQSCDSFLNDLGLTRDTDYTLKKSKSFSDLVGKVKVKVKLISDNAITTLSPESVTRSSHSSRF